jgi:glycosyltransferase involved in cell wall biosynthesis
MKILLLSKRAYTNKDLLTERYGRIYEFSRALVRDGHQVYGVALDYRRGNPVPYPEARDAFDPDWQSCPIFPHPLPGLYRYLRAVRRLARRINPDVIVSVSDVYHVVLGDWLSRMTGCAHVADLYDNYECFGAARVPGIQYLYRKALSRASGVVVVSNSLKEHVQATASPRREPEVILNAVDRMQFTQGSKIASRRRLGLPEEGALVGLGGTISRFRGAHLLLEAHARLLAEGHNIHLALAGAVTDGMEIPPGSRIHYLGELDYRKMPDFYSALDAGIIINSVSSFAQHCFPQKFFEMRACGVPAIVASIGEVKRFMVQCPGGLYEPGNADSLARAIKRQLEERCVVPVEVPDWDTVGKQFSVVLQESCRAYGASRRY